MLNIFFPKLMIVTVNVSLMCYMYIVSVKQVKYM